ncbi:DUF6538 domain-containing protein [Sphingomonas sp. PB4P5]|uniref:DUF6538 domain-containing protein n=1 Tax=Parasphingomonas puruogangriensis TaxID=3096155 RepID=UPI002FC8F2FD
MPKPAKPFRHGMIRDSVYYYQRRVPRAVVARPSAFELHFDSLGQYRRSLKTKVYSEALAQAAIEEQKFDSMVALALGHSVVTGVQGLQSVTTAPRVLDEVALADLSRSIRDGLCRSWREDILAAQTSSDRLEDLERRLERVNEATARHDDIGLILGGSSVDERARRANDFLNFRVDERSAYFGELKMAIRDGLTQARQDIQSMFLGKSLPDDSGSSLVRTFASPSMKTSTQRKLSEVAKKQFAVKNLAPKTVQKYKRAYECFIEAVGDKPIDQIFQSDIHRFLEVVTLREVGIGSKNARPITRTTVQSYLTPVSSLLTLAKGRGWRSGPNPASEVDLSAWVAQPNLLATPNKRRLLESELNVLFAHPWFAGCKSRRLSYSPGSVILDDMRYWAPVIALFTGARAAELGGLKLSEVHLGNAPHIVLQPNEYRRTKGGYSRIVPILDALLELGFAAYFDRVSSGGGDRLFPDWDCPRDRLNDSDDLSRWANGKWVRAFNRTLMPSLFPLAPNETRSAVTFHSLRGSFKKLLEDHGGGKKANAIVGHIHDDLDRRYIGFFSAEDLHEEFHGARFKNIIVPHRRFVV